MTTLHPALAYADKAALAAAGLALLAQVVSAASTAPTADDERALRAAVARIEAHQRRPAAPAPGAPDWASELRAALEPAAVPAARPLIPWLTHRRPGALFLLQAPPEGPKPTHTGPADVVAEAPRPGRVVVRWTPPTGQHVTLKQRLERRAGDGPWQELARPAAGAAMFEDSTVAPRGRYAYRVVSEAAIDEEDAAIVAARRAGAAVKLAAAVRESAPSAEVVAPRGRVLSVQVVTVVPLRPEQGSAQLRVHGWTEAGWDARGKPVSPARVGQRLRAGEQELGAVLEEVGEEERDRGRGWKERVQWARVRWDDGLVETLVDKEPPAELRAPR